MSDIDQVEKYLKWSLEKVEQMKLYEMLDDENITTIDTSSRQYVLKDLINYIEQALAVSRRL